MELGRDRLTDTLLSRAREVRVDDVEGSLAAATTAIVEMGVADSVSITERIGKHEFRTRAATDERAKAADRLQYELGEGPCVEAAYDDDGVIRSNDVVSGSRWPRWGPAAAGEGVRAVISIQLYRHDQTMGALNLFFGDRQDFTTEDVEVARLAAVPISIELAHGRQDENLWKAITARHRIGLAQGILMERFKVAEPQAFGVLRRVSQQTNTKLQVVAERLIREGELLMPADGAELDE